MTGNGGGSVSLRAAWRRLRPADGDRRGGWVALALSAITSCRSYAARALDDGAEALLVEVGTSRLPTDIEVPAVRGVQCAIETASPGRSGVSRLVLRLRDPAFRDVFHVLADDVVSALGRTRDETEAARAFFSRVRHWVAFLRTLEERGLSAETRRGLLGELFFLRERVLPLLGGEVAIRSWQGPWGGDQDFVFPGGRVEVKTSMSRHRPGFRVSSLVQLERTGEKPLVVWVLELAGGPDGNLSLPELIEDVRAGLGEDARVLLEKALVAAGWLEAHAERYRDDRYTVLGEHAFELREGFPRIRPSVVPAGVEDVRYRVDLGACEPFRVDTAFVEALIRVDEEE